MIVPAPDCPPPPSVDAAESTVHRAPKRLRVLEEPAGELIQTFVLKRSLLQIEPGQLLLRLLEHPEIRVERDTLECEVLGWGVRIAAATAEEIPKAMARRFLELFSKADRGQLNLEEQADWVSILDRVDYQSFCIERARPLYSEGVVISRQPNLVRVEWHDGTKENLEGAVARPLMNLRKGDEFSAWVKLGRDNMAIRIENVMLLQSAEAA